MTSHPRRLTACPAFALLALLATATAGCGGKATGTVGSTTLGAAIDLARPPGALATDATRARVGHAWFPLTPGRYADFRVRRFTVDEPTYIRVTLGEPEPFFGRLATPWVYGDVPGLPPDATLHGLRQYFSLAPDGALWFHGAQNNGFMSHTEPPVRQLPAEPAAGAAWVDTVFFESFLPGGEPFYSADQTYAFTLSDRVFLGLPGGPVHALKAAVEINDFAPGGAALARTLLFGDGVAPVAADLAVADAPVAGRDRGDRPVIVPERGLWYARQKGLVAKDYPHGPGPDVTNITTYERIGEGFGPVPAPSSAP